MNAELSAPSKSLFFSSRTWSRGMCGSIAGDPVQPIWMAISPENAG